MEKGNLSKSSKCVHAGNMQDEKYKGVNSPIYTSTAYSYIDVPELMYPRNFNTPNQEVLIKKLCALENAQAGLVLGSGMAAISATILGLLKPGDHGVFQGDIYGGAYSFITNVLPQYNIEYTLTDGLAVEDFKKAIRPNTKIIYIETPSNPLLKIVDVAAIAKLAKSINALTVIDNTFATPVNQTPIDFGIDVVVHSGTKYFGGHSDLMSGAVLASKDIVHEVHKIAVNFGANMNALSCYLLERSLKTLALRVKQQSANALSLARFLSTSDKVSKVYYPGLESHEGHTIAKEQMQAFGAVVSFELNGNIEDADSFVRKLNIITPAMSLGGVESTITSPARSSHGRMSKEERAKSGISDSLLRLSVGIEDIDDLINDIKQALKD